jgi:NAD(P)-dependent dehydrogenase (short-subunit alcohol dehydrogenase family)
VAVVFGASGGIGWALVEAIRAAERFEDVVALGCADWSMTPALKHALAQLFQFL